MAGSPGGGHRGIAPGRIAPAQACRSSADGEPLAIFILCPLMRGCTVKLGTHRESAYGQRRFWPGPQGWPETRTAAVRSATSATSRHPADSLGHTGWFVQIEIPQCKRIEYVLTNGGSLKHRVARSRPPVRAPGVDPVVEAAPRRAVTGCGLDVYSRSAGTPRGKRSAGNGHRDLTANPAVTPRIRRRPGHLYIDEQH